jgi:hypothetical protein
MEIKEKYLKIVFDRFDIVSKELVDESLSNFKVISFIPSISSVLELLNMLKPDYTFKLNNNFLTAENDLDPLSIHCAYNVEIIYLKCDGITLNLNRDNKYNNLKIGEKIMSMFAIKDKQRLSKQALKKQLIGLGYKPDKIKKDSIYCDTINNKQVLHLSVRTQYGKLNVDVDNNGCNLKCIDYNGTNYTDIEQVEEAIIILQQQLEKIEKLKNLFHDIKSEVGNCAVIYDVKC